MGKIYIDIPAVAPYKVAVKTAATAYAAQTEIFYDLYSGLTQAGGKVEIDDADISSLLWSFVYFEDAYGLRGEALIIPPSAVGGATILAKSIVERAGIILSDEPAVGWTKASLLDDLNDGQLELATRVYGASVDTYLHTLVPGPNQELPTGSLRLLRPIRNMGANGSTPGRAIELKPLGIMDRLYPQWTSLPGSGEVLAILYNPQNPLLFQTYPSQPASPHRVELERSIVPTPCTMNGVNGSSVDSVISVSDAWTETLLAFVLGRAFGRETTEASAGKSAAWMGRFDAATTTGG